VGYPVHTGTFGGGQLLGVSARRLRLTLSAFTGDIPETQVGAGRARNGTNGLPIHAGIRLSSGAATASLLVCHGLHGCQRLPEQFQRFVTVAEHWNGRRWAISPHRYGRRWRTVRGLLLVCYGCTASESEMRTPPATRRSPSTGTARAGSSSPPRSAGGGALIAVSCSSAAACTAVGIGDNDISGNETLASTGTARAGLSSPPEPDRRTYNTLSGVSCLSATACTAAGDYLNSSGVYATLAEHWNGTWAIQSTPNGWQPVDWGAAR